MRGAGRFNMCVGGCFRGRRIGFVTKFSPKPSLTSPEKKKDREAFWLLETKAQQRNMYFVLQN